MICICHLSIHSYAFPLIIPVSTDTPVAMSISLFRLSLLAPFSMERNQDSLKQLLTLVLGRKSRK